ncbi:MAG: carboxypeptidase-like regulatory domain-containing protein [Chitinophagaceae bacterium]|nr:carboxypeptidase-like regulatory domain-containing protein [Chitinophagaceae bacterium]
MKKIIVLLFISFSLSASPQNADTTVSFKVQGNCSMCKKRIEDAAKEKGVSSAIWNAQSKMLTLQYDPAIVFINKIHSKLAEAGHDTELAKADDNVYNKLPDCCLYRGKGNVSTGQADETADNGLQNQVMGVIMEEDAKGNLKPLKGASILLQGSNKGIATEENGFFRLSLSKENEVITVSYVGFQPKDIDVRPGDHLSIVLNTAKPLEGIKVVSTRKPAYISPLSTIRTQVMTERELVKAACCNLSESFETNPSVDVSYNDAVTGSKQIQLLGLSGNYTQLTMEALPGPRGIATPWGLNSIPGTWIESIQLSKGVGSVANGFESIAGQINIELKKPVSSEQLYANAYVNNMGKTDLNLNLSRQLGKKWATALLLHDAFLNNSDVDFNKDGFRDLPTGNLFTALNRWMYNDPNGIEGQAGFRILLDTKTGGHTMFDPEKDKLTTNHYGLGIETKRYEAFGKIGYVFPEKKYKSIGLQLSTFRHEQDSYFGTTVYNATQNNFYANLIYQSIISNTNHKFRTGVGILADKYDELFRNTLYKRTETTPGAFIEYTYSKGEKYSLILGMRGDHNSLFGFFFTPRLHMRYEPVKGTVIRLAAGRGQRTANIFAENTGVLVSAREVNIFNAAAGKAYGLDPEIAWNEGISLDQKFRLFNRNGSLGFDFFRTDFQDQVVVDLDQSARQLNFYNLKGRSYSNSLQAEMNYELVKKLDLRLAYRFFDVKTNYHGELLQRPLVSKHRGFANLAYETGSWKFDYTVTYNGVKRIPFTGDNPDTYKLNTTSPSYVIMNAQVSKTFGKKSPVDVYIGGENLTNYFQDRVILGADQPFGSYFDASLVWGPVSGRMFYAGARFKIK